jgi:hypothetical protein
MIRAGARLLCLQAPNILTRPIAIILSTIIQAIGAVTLPAIRCGVSLVTRGCTCQVLFIHSGSPCLLPLLLLNSLKQGSRGVFHLLQKYAKQRLPFPYTTRASII